MMSCKKKRYRRRREVIVRRLRGHGDTLDGLVCHLADSHNLSRRSAPGWTRRILGDLQSEGRVRSRPHPWRRHVLLYSLGRRRVA
jgi:hypothetical protein